LNNSDTSENAEKYKLIGGMMNILAAIVMVSEPTTALMILL
jgi:hypothetical protein